MKRRACPSLAGVVLGLLLGSTDARADVVDDAYARGSAAARSGNWEGAIEHWQQALDLLPGRSAQLEYDLGTAHAQLGQLGPATYHLERALQPESRPSVDVAQAARRNLGIVRRQAEVQAQAVGAEISRPDTWWDLFVVALASPTLGWVTLLCGWALLGVLSLRWHAGRATGLAQDRRGVLSVLAILLATVTVLGGALHGAGLQAAANSPVAIALEPIVVLRSGPGLHAPVALELQGGSQVRVVEERSGWVRVRLPGGLEGWAPAEAMGRLDRSKPVRSRVRASGESVE